MRQLFISYRSSDAVKVDKIARDLTLLTDASGVQLYTTWQDKHNLPPASPHWWDAIVDAIIASDVFVFHVSKASLESDVCRAELDYAHQRNRPIIPVVLEGEFYLDPNSGKYNIAYWELVPDWLAERQFLFYEVAAFYDKFQEAMAVFDRHPPRDINAPRPLNPDNKSEHRTNHARYAQACDYAERLAFAEARNYFDMLVRRSDSDYDDVAAQWLEILHLYEELIEMVNQNSPALVFKKKWGVYAGLFPKDFLEGIFDPQKFKSRYNRTAAPTSKLSTIPVLPSSPLVHPLTAEDWVDKGVATTSIKDKIHCYTEAIRLKPDYAIAFYNRGVAYRNLGKTEQAITDYTEAIRLKPDYAAAFYNRGLTYDSTQDYDLAIADYTQAIQFNPDLADAYTNRGTIHYSKGDYDLAIADYTIGIKLQSEDADAYYNRGNVYRDNGDFDLATADYTQAILFKPDDADAYNNRGDVYQNKKDYPSAIADYTEVIRLKPDFVSAYHCRARAFKNKGDFELAISDFSEAIRLQPNDADSYVSRADAYLMQKHYEQALTDCNRALEIDSKNAYAIATRGEIHFDLMRFDAAIEDFEAALQINPHIEVIVEKLALARTQKAKRK